MLCVRLCKDKYLLLSRKIRSNIIWGNRFRCRVRMSLPRYDRSDDGSHCGGVAALAVSRRPDSPETRPHDLREIEQRSQVHQHRDGPPGARVGNGTWGNQKPFSIKRCRLWIRQQQVNKGRSLGTWKQIVPLCILTAAGFSP